jgi:hypothetical protein
VPPPHVCRGPLGKPPPEAQLQQLPCLMRNLADAPGGRGLQHRAGWAAALATGVQFMNSEGTKNMLWTICVVLLILWALGMATSYTAGGLIHILLVVGLIILVIRLVQGRRILG